MLLQLLYDHLYAYSQLLLFDSVAFVQERPLLFFLSPILVYQLHHHLGDGAAVGAGAGFCTGAGANTDATTVSDVSILVGATADMFYSFFKSLLSALWHLYEADRK